MHHVESSLTLLNRGLSFISNGLGRDYAISRTDQASLNLSHVFPALHTDKATNGNDSIRNIFSQSLTLRLLITLVEIAATVAGREKPHFWIPRCEWTNKHMNGARVTGQNKKTQFITQKNTLHIRRVTPWWPGYFWTRFPSDESWEFTLLPANENDTSISSGDVRLMPQDNFPPSADGWYNDSAFIVQSGRFRRRALLQWIHLSGLGQAESLTVSFLPTSIVSPLRTL